MNDSARDPRIGTMLGGYQLIRRLGKGGMGLVYLAVHQAMQTRAAVKVIAGEPDDIARARFFREAQTAFGLTHPNIVRVLHADVLPEGDAYLVMDYIEGQSLRQFVPPGGLPDRKAVEILIRICAGLAFAHSAGVIHRDIKPENILIDAATHNPRIADFGLTRLEHSESDLTGDRSVLGTPAYMPPEQWQETATVDARADIYALGVTGYFMLSGQIPYDARGAAAILHAVIAQQRVPLLTRRPDLDPALAEIIEGRMMAWRPADRFQRVIDAQLALTAWLNANVSSQVAVGSVPRPPRPVVAAPPPPPAITPPMDHSRGASDSTTGARARSGIQSRRAVAAPPPPPPPPAEPIPVARRSRSVAASDVPHSRSMRAPRPKTDPMVIGGAIAVAIVVALVGLVLATRHSGPVPTPSDFPEPSTVVTAPNNHGPTISTVPILPTESAEDLAFRDLPTSGTHEAQIAALKKFLQGYPGSSHGVAVEARLKKLEIEFEANAFTRLPSIGTIESKIAELRAFGERFPDGKYAAQVKDRLTQLTERKAAADRLLAVVFGSGNIDERISAADQFLSEFTDSERGVDCRRELQRLRELENASASPTPAELRAAYSRASAAYTATDYDLVIEILNPVLDAAPEYIDGWVLRGHAFRMSDRLESAQADFERALRIDPSSADANSGLGWVRFDRGDYAGAKAAFQKAIDANPRHNSSIVGRGLVNMEDGDPDAALADFDRALSIDEKFVVAHIARGDCLVELDRADEAIPAFRRAIEIAPQNWSAWRGLGVALARIGERDEATKAFDEAERLAPPNAIATIRAVRERALAAASNTPAIEVIDADEFAARTRRIERSRDSSEEKLNQLRQLLDAVRVRFTCKIQEIRPGFGNGEMVAKVCDVDGANPREWQFAAEHRDSIMAWGKWDRLEYGVKMQMFRLGRYEPVPGKPEWPYITRKPNPGLTLPDLPRATTTNFGVWFNNYNRASDTGKRRMLERTQGRYFIVDAEVTQISWNTVQFRITENWTSHVLQSPIQSFTTSDPQVLDELAPGRRIEVGMTLEGFSSVSFQFVLAGAK